MCAAKKAAKSGKSSPVAKRAEPKNPSRRESSLSPLPRGEAGESLFVRLQAEKVLKKAHLMEKWEGADGWDFDILCAVVASEMGMASEEQILVAIAAENRSGAKVLAKIRKYASPPIMDGEEGAETLRPEIYEGLLILGLGTHSIPFPERPERPRLSVTDTLIQDLADILEVDAGRVNPRNFEMAKKNVRKRYDEHIAKQNERGRRAASSSTKDVVAKVARTQTSMFHEVFGRLVVQGKGPGKISPEIRQLLAKAGLRLPGSGSR